MNTIAHIAAGTPRWVFVLFFVLLAYGLSQLRERQLSPARLAVMPIAMAGLSFYGVVADFGGQPAHVGAWLLGAGLALGAWLRRPLRPPPRSEAATGTILVPGSAVPLVLMMAIFVMKYGVAVALAMHPAWRNEWAWTLAGALFYGVFTGLFAGRALRFLAVFRQRYARSSVA